MLPPGTHRRSLSPRPLISPFIPLASAACPREGGLPFFNWITPSGPSHRQRHETARELSRTSFFSSPQSGGHTPEASPRPFVADAERQGQIIGKHLEWLQETVHGPFTESFMASSKSKHL